MIDFHNHFLPNVDDGPKSIEETIDMLRFAHNQGITEVVQTVHYQHPKMDGKNVEYKFLKEKIKETQRLIKQQNLNIKLHLSAEVFYLPNLVKLIDNPLLTIGNKKFMLIEFTPSIYPTGYEEQFFELQNAGVTPIIAHPERYRFIKNDITILDKWIDRGYIIQIDAGSVIGQFGKIIKNFSLKMIKNGYVHILGSDSHNNKKRNFCLKECYELIKKLFSFELVELLNQNSELLLKGESLKKVKNKSNILSKKSFNFRLKW